MIDYEFDKASRILRVHPESSLHKQDFIELAKAVDPEIEASGELAGLIIDAAHFPGWDSFGAVVTHMRFVHDHHKHVKKIAVVTDSHLGDFAEHLVSHFISAKIQQFPAGQDEQARQWIVGNGDTPGSADA
ncbi:MAG TPA: STAS/SEC14 domain-containing protein [Mycobacterium sp.]|nr:STAS/SEC14 domain-containing protein [Mycobacterium sp.]